MATQLCCVPPHPKLFRLPNDRAVMGINSKDGGMFIFYNYVGPNPSPLWMQHTKATIRHRRNPTGNHLDGIVASFCTHHALSVFLVLF